MSRALAIDLGTANTLVYVKGQGVRLTQPTVIALNERTGEILAMGDEAYAMIGSPISTPPRGCSGCCCGASAPAG